MKKLRVSDLIASTAARLGTLQDERVKVLESAFRRARRAALRSALRRIDLLWQTSPHFTLNELNEVRDEIEKMLEER